MHITTIGAIFFIVMMAIVEYRQDKKMEEIDSRLSNRIKKLETKD